MSATRKLIEFAAGTDYEKMPEEVIRMAKRCLLDCIGVTLAGSQHPLGAMLQTYLDKFDRIPEATIFGTGRKSSQSSAALVNGALAHVLDFDDSSYSMGSHPTAPIMAALLSVGETNRSSGRQILEAFVLGFEAQCKLGAAMNPSFSERGWHPMGPLGRVGSVIAIGKLLGFEQDKMENALALACATASGISSVAGTHAKAMNSGLAAEAGVRSALFADQGITGPRAILERKGGFCDMFSTKYNLPKLMRNLGEPYDLISPGVAFKQYPSCTATHAAIDAVLAIRQESGVGPDEIERIECKVGPWVPRFLVFPIPSNGLEGKFSMPYCLSVALVNGAVSLHDFEDEAIKNAKVMDMMRRVSVIPDEELERESYVEGAIVTLTDMSGRRHQRRVNKAKGNPENPVSDVELRQKFMACASACLRPEKIEKLANLIMNLEKTQNVAELMNCVYKSGD